jgi:hypothetical protein
MNIPAYQNLIIGGLREQNLHFKKIIVIGNPSDCAAQFLARNPVAQHHISRPSADSTDSTGRSGGSGDRTYKPNRLGSSLEGGGETSLGSGPHLVYA